MKVGEREKEVAEREVDVVRRQRALSVREAFLLGKEGKVKGMFV